MFVDRERELKLIREKLSSDEFELVIIYGRRRVGKTRLILEALKGTDHIYYLAVEGDNVRHFINTASRVAPELKHVKEEWESVFSFLKDRVVVIDEFPNMIKEDPRILSVFQRIVDLQLKGSRTKLFILGSSVSMMKDKVLAYKSPLYGRRTVSLKVTPLKFKDLKGFLRASWKELVEVYGFAGGIPYYLKRVRVPFWDWLDQELTSPDTFIRDEADFLLRYEFLELTTYKRVLEAIAYGKTTPKEIRDYAGMRHTDLMPYLRNLMEVELVRREVPVTERWSSKKGRYYLADNFLRFWFRFIHPNLSLLEQGLLRASAIRREYNQFLGPVYEEVVRQLLPEIMSWTPTRLGRWWDKDVEVDLVAINDELKRALLVEVKWSDLSGREIDRILDRLKEKGKLLLPGYEKEYLVVGRTVEPAEKALGLEDLMRGGRTLLSRKTISEED